MTARRWTDFGQSGHSPTCSQQTNSHTLSQGLAFQPGVRVETDCQNCGYSQVRINGLDGKYTQISIDSRPIFSSLAGVYGLEQIPANMIERVEVVRGGGSALFGSSAIAGTVNIITKEPIRNSGFFSHTISNFDGSGSFDNNTTLNLSLVSSDSKMGAYVYGQSRHRSAWDLSNGDGFSELPKLKNQTVGLTAYYRTSAYSKLSLAIRGYGGIPPWWKWLQPFPSYSRRMPDLTVPGRPDWWATAENFHQHGWAQFTAFSKNQKHTFSTYASAQHIVRNSYYSAYGMTTDFTGVLGAQYIYHFDKCLFMPADLTGGIEFNHDNLHDKATDVQKYRDAALAEDSDGNG